MKNVFALSLMFIFVSSFAFASTGGDSEEQETTNYIKKSELKGPKAKNYHPEKFNIKSVETKTINADHAVKNLQGPNAKNYAPTDFEIAHENMEGVKTNSERKNLQGPKAKNYHPRK